MLSLPSQSLVANGSQSASGTTEDQPGEHGKANKLARLWQEADIEDNLKIRINFRRRQQLGQDGASVELPPITEEMIVNEYYSAWAENFASKDPAKLIINHPALLREDFDRIQNKMTEQTAQKMKWAAISSCCVFGVYSFGLKSHWMFYNFFNRKHRFRAINWTKRVLGVYAVYIGCLSATNYIINQQFEVWLESSGLIEKYHLQYYTAGRQ